MIAPTLYRQTSGAKKAPTFLKYVTQRLLAVLMFIALAVIASIGNKPSDKASPGVSYSPGISQLADNEPNLSLDLRQLFAETVGSIKDAFNDPALIEYAKEQGIDIPGSPTTPCPNTLRTISIVSRPPSSQSSEVSSSY